MVRHKLVRRYLASLLLKQFSVLTNATVYRIPHIDNCVSDIKFTFIIFGVTVMVGIFAAITCLTVTAAVSAIAELLVLYDGPLGFYRATRMHDKHDISRGRSALVSQINNVLCFFRTLDSVTKMRLLIYCYSLYGCVIWDITSAHVEKSVALGELECVVFGAFRSILTMC